MRKLVQVASWTSFLFLTLVVSEGVDPYVSAVGDPGMKRDALRVAIESWNQCNEVGEEAPKMGSPRAADCFDIYKALSSNGNGNELHVSICLKCYTLVVM